jgi:hypothetical protein
MQFGVSGSRIGGFDIVQRGKHADDFDSFVATVVEAAKVTA